MQKVKNKIFEIKNNRCNFKLIKNSLISCNQNKQTKVYFSTSKIMSDTQREKKNYFHDTLFINLNCLSAWATV